MNALKSAVMATLLFAGAAGATSIPAPLLVPNFGTWAAKTLLDQGVTDARVVEVHYPFNFTYCRQDSPTLWRYDVMNSEQLEAIRAGKAVQPLTEAQRTVAVDGDSAACRGEG